MTTQVEFFQNNVIDGALTPEQAAQLLELPEGDTSTMRLETDGQPVAITGQAAAPAVAEVAGKAVESEHEPVILAKDGVHTIPFEKLAEARAAEQNWKQVAIDAQAKLEAAQKATPAEPATAETLKVEDENPFGDYSEEGIKNGVKKLVAAERDAIRQELRAELDKELAPLKVQHAQTAVEAHFAKIEAVHRDFDSIAQSAELREWISTKPSFYRNAYQAIIDHGTAEQVIEALDIYKAETVNIAKTPAKPSAAAAAQAAIEKAKTFVPTSLTDFPGGTSGPGNKFDALDSMSATQLGEAMQNMTPKQIETYLNRI